MMMRILLHAHRQLLCAFVLLCALPSASAPSLAAGTLSEDKTSAVILAYGRIGEDAYPATSLRADQFTAHLEELKRDRYNVAPIPRIIAAAKAGQAQPNRTIGITFSGAYQSAYDNAMRALIENQIPFTVFYATDHADSGLTNHLDWAHLKKLKQTGLVTFGLLPASYGHMNEGDSAETLRNINRARARHREMLGLEADFFSYPFGEYSNEYKDTIKQQGFTAAFGLHSGVTHIGADFFALPRFSMTQNYGSLDRFELVANALPLPATDIEPNNAYLSSDSPAIGFTISPDLTTKIEQLSCFISGQAQPQTEILGKTRVELRLAEALSDERTRVNCTIPTQDSAGEERWRWLGMLLVRKAVAPNNYEPEIIEAEAEIEVMEVPPATPELPAPQ